MLEARSGKPYVWVTHVTELLAGDGQCAWAPWLKAHYRYTKREDDGDGSVVADWIAEHDDLLKQRHQQLVADGYTVTTENQNKYTVNGAAVNLGAKPDIVAVKGDTILISDPKGGGKAKPKYIWQVRVYMATMPMVDPRFKNKRVVGEIVLPGPRSVAVDLDADHRRRINRILREVGDRRQPKTVPSAWECRFCDIDDCPDRFSAQEIEGDSGGAF